VDLAIEVPLPDLDCRRRLIELYARGLRFKGVDLDALARKTDGVSGAFIRELLRKSALYAVDAASDALEERHVDTALHELTILGGDLTRSILGGGAAGLDKAADA
jgi:ATP-dependent 26S proteasome regulatory subunit